MAGQLYAVGHSSYEFVEGGASIARTNDDGDSHCYTQRFEDVDAEFAEVVDESGFNKRTINAAWDAIGEVIKAWATEGHSVAVPGLGSMRFGIRSTSVANLNKVGTDLITSRRVIFTPSLDIKNELKATSINITCYDRNGDIVKRVTSSEDSDVEEPEDDGKPSTGSGQAQGGSNNSGTSGTGGSNTNNGTSGTSQKYTVSVASNNPDMGTVSGGGQYTKDAQATSSTSGVTAT